MKFDLQVSHGSGNQMHTTECLPKWFPSRLPLESYTRRKRRKPGSLQTARHPTFWISQAIATPKLGQFCFSTYSMPERQLSASVSLRIWFFCDASPSSSFSFPPVLNPVHPVHLSSSSSLVFCWFRLSDLSSDPSHDQGTVLRKAWPAYLHHPLPHTWTALQATNVELDPNHRHTLQTVRKAR